MPPVIAFRPTGHPGSSLKKSPDTYGSNAAHAQARFRRYDSRDPRPRHSYVSSATQEPYPYATFGERKFRHDIEQDSYGCSATDARPPSVYSDPMAVNHLIDSSQFRPRERQLTGRTISEARSNRSDGEAMFVRNIASAAQRRFASSSGAELPTDAGCHTTLQREQSPTDDIPNVIIFGETGVGKSSLINMIAGTPSAAVSSCAIGCTFESIPYVVELKGLQYRLWDTAGLNEGENGNISADRAIESLQELVRNLQYRGVSLLVYCIRGSRLREIVKINYDLFHTIICGAQVPIVVAVTGLENEEDMEDWWKDNVQDFDDRGMRFAGHACVTTTKGRVIKGGQHTFKEEYSQSIKLVRKLIVSYCLESSWKPDNSRWLCNIVERMRGMYVEIGGGNRARDSAEIRNRARAFTPKVNPQTHYEMARQEPAGRTAAGHVQFLGRQVFQSWATLTNPLRSRSKTARGLHKPTPTHAHITSLSTSLARNDSFPYMTFGKHKSEQNYTTSTQRKTGRFLGDLAEELQRQTYCSSRAVAAKPSRGYPILPSTKQSTTLHPEAMDNTPNVIIFGETGVGKSSLINMITEATSAAVSDAAIGCTFKSAPYDAKLSSRNYRLWDTAGLNEGERGNVPADRAIESLQTLVQSLKDGGVSLLVYCIRGSRLRDIIKINYDLFHKIICGGKVPIVVVITGLENEDDMDDWWKDNAEDFFLRGMSFSAHACVTTTKGKVMRDGQHMFEAEYNRSVGLVREIIASHCAKRPWTPNGSTWLWNIAENMRQMYSDRDGARDYGRDYR